MFPSNVRLILVTGSRDWSDADLLGRVIGRVHNLAPYATLLHGDCRGVDQDAARIWDMLGGVCIACPADWATYGRAAGPIRNKEMVERGPDVCIAFIKNESRGASQCANLAEHAGITTYRFR